MYWQSVTCHRKLHITSNHMTLIRLKFCSKLASRERLKFTVFLVFQKSVFLLCVGGVSVCKCESRVIFSNNERYSYRSVKGRSRRRTILLTDWSDTVFAPSTFVSNVSTGIHCLLAVSSTFRECFRRLNAPIPTPTEQNSYANMPENINTDYIT